LAWPSDMTNPRKVLVSAGSLYVIAFLVLSGVSPTSLPIVLAAVLYTAYPIWFAGWLVALFGTLWILGGLYGKTKMGMWWWLSAPYSLALPLLSLILGLGGWAFAHMLGLFVLLAYLTVPSSLLWAIVAVTLAFRGRKRATNDWIMLSVVVLMVVLWIIVVLKMRTS